MSGSISTLSARRWVAAGWVFRNILDRTAEVLTQQGHTALADILVKQEGAVRTLELLDLAELPEIDRKRFGKALEIAYKRYLSEGSGGWHQPEFFPGFIRRVDELIQIISSDPGAS